MKEDMDRIAKKLHKTIDAKVWTEEYLKTVTKDPSIATDEETMNGWFANAIMVGYDRARADVAAEDVDIETAINKGLFKAAKDLIDSIEQRIEHQHATLFAAPLYQWRQLSDVVYGKDAKIEFRERLIVPESD